MPTAADFDEAAALFDAAAEDASALLAAVSTTVLDDVVRGGRLRGTVEDAIAVATANAVAAADELRTVADEARRRAAACRAYAALVSDYYVDLERYNRILGQWELHGPDSAGAARPPTAVAGEARRVDPVVSDEIWLDPAAARALAADCRTASGDAEAVRDRALTAMTLSELTDVGAPALLAELADELAALSQLVDLKAELMEYSDIPSTEGWLLALYRRAGELDAELTASLHDDIGTRPPVPSIGAGNLQFPAGAEIVTFDIPVWEGAGTTRIQYFIDDHDVCLSGTGPDVMCGEGDDRSFVAGVEITDYNVPARVRIVFDHDLGLATLVSYPTHGTDGEVDPLPVEVTIDGPVELPDEYPSQLRIWTEGDGIDGNIVFDYRFLNSETPRFGAGMAPAINGAVRIRRNDDGTVSLDGRLAQYPSVEIIRDRQLPNGYHSTLIFTKEQESGGPLNLIEQGESFEVEG